MSNNASLPGYQHVDHLGVTVRDLDAAVDFYCRTLGADVAYSDGRVPVPIPSGSLGQLHSS